MTGVCGAVWGWWAIHTHVSTNTNTHKHTHPPTTHSNAIMHTYISTHTVYINTFLRPGHHTDFIKEFGDFLFSNTVSADCR